MKKTLLFTLYFGLTICCVSQNQLSDNKTFKQSFIQTEIQDLQLLFDFFNQNICPDFYSTTLTSCYTNFFKRMKEKEETGDIPINISFEKQKKVYGSFTDNTFQEIWSFGKSWNYKDASQDTFRRVHINLNGKYLEFLRKVGKNDKIIKRYYKLIKSTGSISPGHIADLLMNYSKYDIKDIRVKFIVAIHYLTLNDRFERKEKI